MISEDMYDDGYKAIWNMDISPLCIEQMIERNKEKRPEQNWEVMDVRDLKYENEMFDVIIDKSTIDAIMCGDNAHMNVAIMLKEC